MKRNNNLIAAVCAIGGAAVLLIIVFIIMRTTDPRRVDVPAGTGSTASQVVTENTTREKKKKKGSDGFVVEDGVTRYYTDGTAAVGFLTVEGKTYFFDAQGAMTFGFATVDGKQYYFGQDGAMTVGAEFEADGIKYVADVNGVCSVYKDPSEYKIAMLGDSLVHNIATANVTDRIDFYGKSATHVDDYYDKKISGSDRFVIDEIKDRDYDIIILMVGINDVYLYEDADWLAAYRSLIAAVKERAPEAQIYLHGMLPVNDAIEAQNDYSTDNADIQARNRLLASLADEQGLPYIDADAVLADESGFLKAELTTDGIHMNVEGCRTWADYLLATLTA
ncbi:MAG: hypothetical protein K6C36_09145 [Clostridia bacterium]|nr:hypothetical protein [Clostridia bacterium]